MDDIDQHIVSCLVVDGRASFREIGEIVGLSAPAVKRRVDRLQASGVISSFTARLDQGALGWNTQAFVNVTFRNNVSPARMQEALAPIPEVVAAYTVSGDSDLVVHIRASNMQHFEQALERLRALDSVDRTESTIVLSTLIDRPSPVDRH
ncbi:Lrp/AsnC family transcriptional regulator [Nakamurella antarctica]|uniref:Lrp/AsnC family transcriptional regulator n=1 Tax=Nakamurella antarctica TaxID=1902245 RepID=A0A3G8ZR15_9ACTN|nr:Lrp/AsnC family transcriptional regulator [Nakamurella antarctica]